MAQRRVDQVRGGSPAENYERYFVPAISAPMATDLLRATALRPGDRVLDVACGTGFVARCAAQLVGPGRLVAGVDVSPDMLAVARSVTPPGNAVEWHEASAESMPFPDDSFDVALCQMGLQFFPDRQAALRELRRILVPGGRLALNLPGPAPRIFTAFAEALGRHAGDEAAAFVNHVFSLHETSRLEGLTNEAGFRDVAVRADTRRLRLPSPEEFLQQYVGSTPLAGAVSRMDGARRLAMEREVVKEWSRFVEDGALVLEVRVVLVTARK